MPPLLKLMRPHQWVKNVFVFAGLIFSHSWLDMEMLLPVLGAFGAFCAVSSAVYILNDWRDREADARHPTKRLRPLASGAVSPTTAGIASAALLGAGGVLAGANTTLWLLLLVYVAINLLYSWQLKRVPIVDVWVIASGFMLRLLAGTAAVDIAPSRWMLLTGLFMALFLGFCKRKAETFHDVDSQRAVLAEYPGALIDMLMAACMTATLMTYGLFATSDAAVAQHGERLALTVPLVVFGMMRYAYQVHQGRGEDVSRELLKDPWILGTAILWMAIFLGGRGG
jgi:decaprenyl-phosphate phosphoribosyltransferase